MPAIVTEGLVKTFGKVRALDGLDLSVDAGTVLGLLGPNGAGKTTAVRVLTTLLKPDSGAVTIAGIDAIARPDDVRRIIGVSGQYAAVDEYLTGRENLVMFAELYQMPRHKARARADELLEQFALEDAADRPVKGYSGGMRRRLDLAGAIVSRPQVLFLDEPTTGLDPRSRNDLWGVIDDLVRLGTTVLLTTQYLEEADELAHQIVVVDHGMVIERGTSDQLKARVGGESLHVVVAQLNQLDAAVTILRRIAVDPSKLEVDPRLRSISVPVRGIDALTDAVSHFRDADIALLDIALRRPSLDDVFLALTGHPTDPGDAA
jgi:ABC-2 type transport system ATP-binding protein